jgi:hypothetical protein
VEYRQLRRCGAEDATLGYAGMRYVWKLLDIIPV